MKKKYIVLIVILALLLLSISFYAGVYVGTTPGKLDVIAWVIEEKFALDYDEKKVEDFAAKAMVYALGDPYSEYMTAEESKSFQEFMSGYYKGIGVALEYESETDRFFVVEVEKGSPAEVAGIKKGDVILKVDDIESDLQNYEKMIYYIKGISEDAPPDDTAMSIKVLRDEKELEFSVKRKELTIDNVESKMIDDILYIKFSEFTETAPEDIKDALSNHKNFNGIILDLKDNSGGDLDSLIEIAEQILPKGILLTTENAKGEKTEYLVKDNKYCDVPLAVLVSGDTASAAEVLSAAIKETNRGLLIGETTYGKGLVQELIPLGDGSYLRLTIEKYYTAGGNYINKIGVKPDIETADEEQQIAKAIEYIKGEAK